MTGLQQHLTTEEMSALGWIDADGNVRMGFKTPAQGAATSVWAAVGLELAGHGGRYLEDCNEAEPAQKGIPFAGVHAHARDPEAAARLWEISEEMVRTPFVF